MATVTLKGNSVNLCGKDVNVGDSAPEVTLVNKALGEVSVGGQKGTVQVLVAVPSLDTPVCAAETRKFNEQAASLDGVEVKIISMDLPFAAGRFCTAEGIEKVETLSDYREKAFSAAYGIQIADGVLKGLNARAIFVVDKDGKVTYKELVTEITAEPNYEAALDAVKAVKSTCCGGGCH